VASPSFTNPHFSVARAASAILIPARSSGLSGFAEEKLKVTAEDIEAEFKDMAASYRMSVDQIKHYVNADDLSYDLSLRKALDFIKDKAVALKPEPKTTGKKAANEEKDA
ncbi:MAG: hypothetical protein II602_03020, partial [Erysipelotrichales bacterium]|nr:hypothetical protein [Erysipelotrichales bacterium]